MHLVDNYKTGASQLVTPGSLNTLETFSGIISINLKQKKEIFLRNNFD